MKRRIGAHLSVAKGFIHAVQEMESMGGNCMQIFSGSPRVWARKPLSDIDVSHYLSFVEEHDFGPTITHALYLVNLASDNPELVQKSTNALKYDLEFDAKIHGGGVVVHLGSHQGRGYEVVFDQLVSSLKDILDSTPKSSTFLVENSAGQNGKLCSDFADILKLFDALRTYVESGRLGWCFDTCHAYANGYDLDTVEEEIKKHKLLSTLRVIHLNDSRDPFESGRDRHDNIGEGSIGKEKMQRFLHNKTFEHIPVILEVPGFDGNGPDKKNMDIVLDLINS